MLTYYLQVGLQHYHRYTLSIRKRKLTEIDMDELEKLRKQCVEYLRKHRIRYRYITCDFCSLKNKCEYAYDPYNIDGDCLAIK